MFKNNILQNKNGFTLIEVLLSLTLIFLIVFPLFGFFLQAFNYTMDSKNKTVAVNIARNVVNYVEKQDFYKMKAFSENYMDSNSMHFSKLTWTDCVKDVGCIDNNKEVGLRTFSVDETCKLNQSTIDIDIENLSNSKINKNEDDLPLFSNGAEDRIGEICINVLSPIINSEIFDEKDIRVYVTNHYSSSAVSKGVKTLLKDYKIKDNRELDELETKLNQELENHESMKISDYTLLKVYVVVKWQEKGDNIVLEGVISDEAVR